MKTILKLLRYAWYTGWYALAISVVLAAVALSLLRLSLPTIAENYSDEVEAILGDVLQRPVTIGGMDADWEGLGPRLILRDVVFLQPDNKGVSLSLESASLGFSISALFTESRFGLSTISLSGFNLIMRRDKDGLIDFSGLAETSAEAIASASREQDQAGRGFAAWLFAHGHVEVADANLFWIDHRNKDRVWRFSDVNVALHNRRGRYRLQGRAGLPEELGRQLEFVLDLGGDVTRPESWSGRTWLRIDELQYSSLRQALEIEDGPLTDGRISTEVWGELRRGQPQSLLGTLAVSDLHLQHQQQPRLQIESLATRFRWRRRDDGMDLDLADFNMQRQKQSWRNVRVKLAWRKQAADEDAGMRLVQAYSSYVDVRGALQLADYFTLIPESAQDQVRQLAASGVVRDLHLQRSPENGQGLQVAAEFSGLSLRPVGKWPGVVGASGRLRTDLEHTVIDVDSQGARLVYPDYMVRPLAIDQIEGTVYVRRHEDYVQVNTSEMLVRNQESKGNAMVRLYWPSERERPWLEIFVGLRQAQAPVIMDYLPVTVISEPLRKWWRQAVRKGRVTDAQVVYSGWTNEYPHADGSGMLAIQGHVRGLDMRYLEDWPALRGATLDLSLAGGDLRMDVRRGRIRRSPVAGSLVEVLDIDGDDPRVRVRASVSGATADKAEFVLAAPPLAKMFSAVADYEFEGDSRLDLDIIVPILHAEDVKVSGDMSVTNNTLAYRGDLGEIATAVTTRIRFENDEISARDGAGLLFGQPVRLAARTLDKGKDKRAIEVIAKGDYQVDSLLSRFGVENWSHIGEGEDKFLAILQLPLGESNRAHPQINISASLRNIESLLPSPLSKEAGGDRTLNLRLVLKPDVHEWYVNDGRRLRAAVAMLPLQDEYAISHGEVLVGRGRPDLAWKDGLRLRADVRHFSIDDWMKVIEGVRGPSAPGKEAGWDPLPAWVQRVELNAERLQLFEREYRQVRLRADKHEAGLLLAVNSQEIIGDINLPANPAVPINLRLQYWNLLSSDEEQPTYSKPTDLPAMSIECDDFRFNNGALGHLSVVVSPIDDGLRMEKLEIHSSHTNLVGVLEWTWREGAHHSSIDLSIESQNVGKTMSGLGYAGTVKGGSGVLSMKADWPAPPPEYLSDQLNGEIHMNLKDGSLLEIDPGAGRALAIFSLQMLPQRLLLDFSDLYSEGFAFDSVGGDFTIQEGDAYTANLLMEGPSSKILIAGRTGLASRDYDQLVTVIPEVTASIPVLTWWLVDLPAGVLALALQKLFQSEIDDVVKFHYIISGSWNDPVITKVEPEPTTANEAPPADLFDVEP